jgi:plastocyanin
MNRLRKLALLLAAPILVVIVGLAIMGDGDGDEASGGETTDQAQFEKEHPGSAIYGSPPLEFEADPGGDLAYTTDEVTAEEGNVTLEFTNPQSTPHNVTVEAIGEGKEETRTISRDFAAVTVTLNKEREFIFYCSVPGHRKAGMEGKVVVH